MKPNFIITCGIDSKGKLSKTGEYLVEGFREYLEEVLPEVLAEELSKDKYGKEDEG